jgi:hypothetical protein
MEKVARLPIIKFHPVQIIKAVEIYTPVIFWEQVRKKTDRPD